MASLHFVMFFFPFFKVFFIVSWFFSWCSPFRSSSFLGAHVLLGLLFWRSSFHVFLQLFQNLFLCSFDTMSKFFQRFFLSLFQSSYLCTEYYSFCTILLLFFLLKQKTNLHYFVVISKFLFVEAFLCIRLLLFQSSFLQHFFFLHYFVIVS